MPSLFKVLFLVYLIQNFDPGASITVPFTSLSPRIPLKTETSANNIEIKTTEAAKNTNPVPLTAVNSDLRSGSKSLSSSVKCSASCPQASLQNGKTSSAIQTLQDGKTSSVFQCSTPTTQSISLPPQRSFSQSDFESVPRSITSQINSRTVNNVSNLISSNDELNLLSSTKSFTCPSSVSFESAALQTLPNTVQSSTLQVESPLSLQQKTCKNSQTPSQSLYINNNYLSRFPSIQTTASQQQDCSQKKTSFQPSTTNNYVSQKRLTQTNSCDNPSSFTLSRTAGKLSDSLNTDTPDIKVEGNLNLQNNLISVNTQNSQLSNQFDSRTITPNSKDIVPGTNSYNNNFCPEIWPQSKYSNFWNFNSINSAKGSQDDNVNTNSALSQQAEANQNLVSQNQQQSFVNNLLNSGKTSQLNSLNGNSMVPCGPPEVIIEKNLSQQNQNVIQNGCNNVNTLTSFGNVPPLSNTIPFTPSCNFNPGGQNNFTPNSLTSIGIQPQIASSPNNFLGCSTESNYPSCPSINQSIQSSGNQSQNQNLQYTGNNNLDLASPLDKVSCGDSPEPCKTISNELPYNQNPQFFSQTLPNSVVPFNPQLFFNYEQNFEPKLISASNKLQSPINILNGAQNSDIIQNQFSNLAISDLKCDSPTVQVTENSFPNFGSAISFLPSPYGINNQQNFFNTQPFSNCLNNNVQVVDFGSLYSYPNAQDVSKAQIITKDLEQPQNSPAGQVSSDCNLSNKGSTIITTTGATRINKENVVRNDDNNCNIPSFLYNRIPNTTPFGSYNCEITPLQSYTSPNISPFNAYTPVFDSNVVPQQELKSTTTESYGAPVRVMNISPNFTYFGNLGNIQNKPQQTNDCSCVDVQNNEIESIPSKVTTLTISPNFSYFNNIAPVPSYTADNSEASYILPYFQDQLPNNVEIPFNRDTQPIQPKSTQLTNPVNVNVSPIYQNTLLDSINSLLSQCRSNANQDIGALNTPSEIMTEPPLLVQPIQEAAIEIPSSNTIASINQNVGVLSNNAVSSCNQYSNTPVDFSSLFPYCSGASISAPVIEVATTNPSTFYSYSQSYPSSIAYDSVSTLSSSVEPNSGSFLPLLPPPQPLLIDSSRKSRPYDSVLKLLLLTELLSNDNCNDLNSLLALLAAYNF